MPARVCRELERVSIYRLCSSKIQHGTGEANQHQRTMVKDWSRVKSAIHHLYITQGQTLEQVKDAIARQYNFVAS